MQYFFLEREGLIMAKLVLAYPELNENDFHQIQTFREEHDEFFFKRVRPHFTFVFSVKDMTEKDFKEDLNIRLVIHVDPVSESGEVVYDENMEVK